MTRKPAPQPEAQTVTIQLGLAAAIGEGAATLPEPILVPHDQLRGRIEEPDPARYNTQDRDNGLPRWSDFLQGIQERGLDVPVSIRPHHDGGYDIVDGRHRELAIKILRLPEVPCLLSKHYNDGEAALAEIVTNTQRSRTSSPYREGLALRKAMKANGWTVKEVAKKVGRSTNWVHERLCLSDQGFPEHIARRIGVDLALDCAEPFVQLAPQASYLLAAVADIKIPPSQSAWQVRQAVTETLRKQKLIFPIGLDHDDRQRLGGHENKTYEKRAKQLPLVTIGNTEFTTDGAKLNEIIQDETAKWREKQQKNAAAEKASAGPKKRGPTVDARAKVRMPGAQRGLAAKRVKGLVAWNDDLQCALAQTFLEANFHGATLNDADEAALAEALGIDAKKVSPLRLALGDTEKFKAYWKKERAQADKLLLWVLFAHNRTTDHIQYGAATKSAQILEDDAWCKLLTGKTEKDTLAALKEEVRAELDAKGKGKAKPAKLDPRRAAMETAVSEPTGAEGDGEGGDDQGA